MRLVCEQCSSVYTIEDDLVGDRDFRVSCKQCGTPIVVKHERDTLPPVGAHGAQATPFNGTEGKLSPRPPRPPASYAPTGREEWFLWIEGSQRGPYKAEQVAAFIEGGQIDWATQVWRDGFKDWRAARRDATLVTAVAGARGVAGDTMRLNAARSFLAPEDTIVDTRANIFAPSSQRVSVASSSGGTTTQDMLSSTSETQAIDARDLPLPPKPEASPSNRPNLRPNPPPAQLNSPENAAFRAGLGLPIDTQAHRAVKPTSKPPRSASGAPAAPGTVGEAFRSAPNLLKSSAVESVSGAPQQPLSEARETWLPRPQSLLAVAALAFAGGVLAAAVASRYVVRHKEPQTTHMAASAPAPEKTSPPPAPVVPGPAPAAPDSATPAPAALAMPAPAAPAALRELPEPEELRAEVRRVAPDVRRCIIDPALGVDVGVFFDGATGKVRNVEVRTPQISPGRVDCVVHATRQMQLVPFSRAELKLEHKFSW
jgi:predicted Zn finger-like uncharacterized protein